MLATVPGAKLRPLDSRFVALSAHMFLAVWSGCTTLRPRGAEDTIKILSNVVALTTHLAL